ncbi:MAG: DMT family transporter, partial [Acidimicrobiales bacterium]
MNSAAHMASSHTLVGVGITVASAVLYNVGFVLEKHGLGGLPEVHARRLVHLVRSVASSPLWLVGFFSMLGGLGLQIIALSLIPVSIVQPIFVSGIVLLLVLSHLALGEHLGRREWAGVAVVGAALFLLSLSLDSRSDQAGTRGTITGILATAAPTVLVALWIFAVADRLGHGPNQTPHARRHLQAPLYGMSAGLVYGVASLSAKAVSSQLERSGIVAGVPHVLTSPYLYILGVSSAGGLLLFQTALQRCPASVVVPVSNVISSAFVVAAGTALFGEHLPGAGWRVALRIIGFAG